MLTNFDRLVLRGCKQKWCWKLYCTTCGSMEFRNGMEVIGMGLDPLADEGASLRNGLRWRDPPEEFAARTLALGCQVATANAREFYDQHDGIDWLGFMGLALWRIENSPAARVTTVANEKHAENCELLLNLISNSWSSQFYSLLTESRDRDQHFGANGAVSEALDCCKRIIRGERPRFGIADLETMERAIHQLIENRRRQPSTT